MFKSVGIWGARQGVGGIFQKELDFHYTFPKLVGYLTMYLYYLLKTSKCPESQRQKYFIFSYFIRDK